MLWICVDAVVRCVVGMKEYVCYCVENGTAIISKTKTIKGNGLKQSWMVQTLNLHFYVSDRQTRLQMGQSIGRFC